MHKSSSQSVEAVVAGQVMSSCSAVNAALPHIKSGRVRELEVASEKRSSFAPDVPTFEELSVKGMKSGTWLGMLAPPGMPPAGVLKINTELARLLVRPDFREKVLGLGAEPVAGVALEKYSVLMREEIDSYAAIIKVANIKPE